MQKFDKALGRFAPNRQAAHSAPPPKHVVVFGADAEQGELSSALRPEVIQSILPRTPTGRSVCKQLVADGAFILYGLVDDPKSPVATGMSPQPFQPFSDHELMKWV